MGGSELVGLSSDETTVRAPGMAFWDVAIISVLARLGRHDDEIARNGVLGRYVFFGPSLANTKR